MIFINLDDIISSYSEIVTTTDNVKITRLVKANGEQLNGSRTVDRSVEQWCNEYGNLCQWPKCWVFRVLILYTRKMMVHKNSLHFLQLLLMLSEQNSFTKWKSCILHKFIEIILLDIGMIVISKWWLRFLFGGGGADNLVSYCQKLPIWLRVVAKNCHLRVHKSEVMGLGSFNITPSGGPRYGLVGRVVGGGEDHRRPKGFWQFGNRGDNAAEGDGNVLYGPGSGYDQVTLFGLISIILHYSKTRWWRIFGTWAWYMY